MPEIRKRSLDAPDEALPLGDKASGERVTVSGAIVKRATFEPGWHWREHVGSDLCSSRHVGYVVSGRLHVEMEDGNATEIGRGDAVVIEPGHDAWTVGEEACVFIDFGESVSG
jgi:quercetin dioxygenase-like cupin family protein